jgi:type I restriction enzyme, S subunit
MVPNGWKKLKLKECARFQEGYVNPTQTISEYFGNEIKWLRANDLNNSYVFETSRRLSKKGFESAGKSALLFKPNTLAITKSGSIIGRVGILKDYMCGNRAVINIEVNENICDTKFIFYSLLLNQSTLQEMASGSVQKNLYISVLGNLELDVPSLLIQRKIVDILSPFDEKIVLIKKRKEVLDAIGSAIYKNWFIDFEFPDGEGNPYKSSGGEMIDSNSRQIPKWWIVGKLGDIIEQKTDRINERPAIVLSAIQTGELIKSEDFFFKQVYSKEIKKYLAVEQWDFAYNPSRINIGSIGLMKAQILGAVSPVYVVFRPIKDYHWFIELTLKLSSTKTWINTLSSGSVRQSLSFNNFASIPCIIPPNKIVIAFNKIYNELYKGMVNLTEQSATLIQIRDSILPKIMSGQIPVKITDKETDI